MFMLGSQTETRYQSMSFAATLALISGYEYLRPFYKKIAENGFFVKFSTYFISLMLTSIIASLATAPYSIYHFHQVATLGIVANMIAVPVASIWVMPWLVAALFLMPFGAEKLAMTPASWGIDLIIKSAEFVASFKNTYHLVPEMPVIALALITFGGLWLLLWQTNLRFFGVLIIFIGTIFCFNHQRPDVIIDSRGKLYAIRGNDNLLYFSSLVSARYSRKSWQEINGQQETLKIKNAVNKGFTCDKQSCAIEKNGNSLKIFHTSSEVDCAYSRIIIDLTGFDKKCESEDYFNLADLRTNGTHVFYLKSKTISTVNQQLGNRIWQ